MIELIYQKRLSSVTRVLNKKLNPHVMENYKLLQKRLIEMKRENAPIWDLSYIYKDVRKDIYIDDCCHVNDLGLKIMSDEISKRI